MIKKLALFLIRFYQRVGRFFGLAFQKTSPVSSVCRFRPTCSDYTYQAIAKYGILTGSLKALGRIIRCHPWSKGGFDPVN